MEISQEILGSVAQEIWSSMLGIELELELGVAPGGMAPPERTLTGCVQITGSWNGAVTVKCPTSAAHVFAGVMFDTDPDSLPRDEVCDALGELTNMTGGSVKGMVPGDCTLGIPTVAEGVEYSLSIPRAVPVTEVSLVADGQPLEVVVYEVKA